MGSSEHMRQTAYLSLYGVCTGSRAAGHQEMEGSAVLPDSHEDAAVTGAHGRSCTCYLIAELILPFLLLS